ncbi:MAG: YkgJ family cysteine cluster protein [Thiothrix sp.]|nr:MAG: YkgJ family cysteine cluster protein [Thiothrix sp.]
MRECNQCGKCCTKYSNGGLSASADEIEYWDVFRPNIARYVRDGHIWMDPDTGEQIERCPWLRKEQNQDKVTCDIYNDRPDDCKFYPVTLAEMIKDECEMLEAKDFRDPEQAQKNLNQLMADSRPAFE